MTKPKKPEDLKKRGRRTKYKPKYAQQLIEFFDIEPFREVIELITYKDGTTKEVYKEVANDIPFFSQFAREIGVDTDTLTEWRKKEDKKGKLVYLDFSLAYKKAKEIQKEILVINGLRNNYNSGFACFTAKNIIGWRDRTDITSDDKPISAVIDWGKKQDGK